MSRQKIAILPKLHDYQGDTSKKWYVHFSYKNESSGRMQRFRIYNGFSGAQTKKERYTASKKIIESLTTKLRNGWNPFEDDTEVIYEDQVKYDRLAAKQGRLRQSNKTFNFYFSQYLTEKKPGSSPATYHAYKSKLRIFEDWLAARKLDGISASEFGEKDAKKFVLWMQNDRKIGSNTLRHYLVLLNAVFVWMIKQNAFNTNPFHDIHIKKTPSVPAKYFDDGVLDKIKEIVMQRDPQLWLASLFQYYCFIRPKELRELRINDIDFSRGSIQISGKISKNRKTQTVVIPAPFLKYLNDNKINKYPGDYYVVTRSGVPGPDILGKNYLHNRFVKIREALGLSMDYKFYSFKHTGAVKASQYVPIKVLQMQLRHHSLDQVDSYLRQMTPIDSNELKNLFPEI